MLLVTGSYTEKSSPAKKAAGKGLTLYRFSPEPPFLEILQEIYLRNPSYPVWIAENNVLLAAEEIMSGENPVLASYQLENEELTPVEQLILPGSSPCHKAVVGDRLVIANYSSNDVCIIDFSDELLSEKEIISHKHEGKGWDPERQDASHPHMVYPIDHHSFWVPDLGLDCIYKYERSAEPSVFRRDFSQTIQLPPGTGPRHMISLQKAKYLVVVGELKGELFLFKKEGASYQLVHSLSLLNHDSGSAAAIKTDPSEKFIYVSERDSHSIYQIEVLDDALKLINTVPCKGDTPRDISIDPSGNWLLAANQDSNSITVFSIRPTDGHLIFEQEVASGSPVCITWLPV